MAQTKVKLGLVTPGTEKVQLVYNGDFGSQGILVNGSHPYPDGWVNTVGKISADPGINVVAVNDNVVARVDVTSPAVPLYLRFLQLEPNTTYVLSSYMWNFGDSANRVTTVIDFNDIVGEPQMTLAYNDADADKGYFVYRSFNSATTGTNVTLRLFCDGFTGTGAALNYFPIGAQWDNIAVTKSSEFVAPNLGGNIRPTVRITDPTVPLTITRHGTTPKLQIDAAATDFDGSVARVDFYEGTNFLGQKFSPPYFQVWSNFTSGSYRLTAVATDNLGTRTVSAILPVSISVLPIGRLKISSTAETVSISWSTAATSAGLLVSTNLSETNWTTIKTSVAATDGTNTATITLSNKQQFFRLGDDVDNSTMHGKHMMGYQGWFSSPNDGSYANRWQHWFKTQSPTEPNLRVDMWPDISELDPDELFTTSMTLSNGAPATVYS